MAASRRKFTPGLYTPLAEVVEVSFIDEVISSTADAFVPGQDNEATVKESVAAMPPAERAKKYWPTPTLVQKDEHFSPYWYDANILPDCPYIAAAGPSEEEVPRLLRSTVLHPTESITRIIAVVERLHRTPEADGEAYDCYNYIFNSTPLNIEGVTFQTENHHAPNVDELRLENCNITHVTINVTDETTTNSAKLNVTTIGLTDGCAFLLSDNDDEDTELKDLLSTLAANTEPTLVHCHAGVGRTGFLIFTLMLIKQYNEIFNSTNPAVVAKNIISLLEKLREPRPGLVSEPTQFSAAIHNAHVVHGYVLNLEKKRQLTAARL